jgi:hypothetical protein
MLCEIAFLCLGRCRCHAPSFVYKISPGENSRVWIGDLGSGLGSSKVSTGLAIDVELIIFTANAIVSASLGGKAAQVCIHLARVFRYRLQLARSQ